VTAKAASWEEQHCGQPRAVRRELDPPSRVVRRLAPGDPWRAYSARTRTARRASSGPSIFGPTPLRLYAPLIPPAKRPAIGTEIPRALDDRKPALLEDRFHYNARERVWGSASASESSDERFLDRITVNYVRHELTNYDGLLASLHGKVGIAEAKELVRERVYDAICDAYPALLEECLDQEDWRRRREEW